MTDEVPPWERYSAQSAPDQEAPPWVRFANADPTAGIDYDLPRHEVWRQIDKLPEQHKYEAYRKWAERRVANENAKSVIPRLPSSGTGIPLIGGWLDEAASGINAGLEYAARGVGSVVTPGTERRSYTDLYNEELALLRERERQAREANPVLAVAGDVLAGVATGGPLLRFVPMGGATTAGRIAAGAATGAGLGAYEGYSRGEGSAADRARGAESGAKWGGLFGAVTPAALSAGAYAYNAAAPWVSAHMPSVRARLPQWLTGATPDEAASGIIAGRMQRAGMAPSDVTRYLAEGERARRFSSNSYAQSADMLADVNPELTRLTGGVYRSGGDAANVVKEALDQRQMGARPPYAPVPRNAPPSGQAERVEDATRRALLVETADTARATEAQLNQGRSATADALYSQARANSEAFDLQPAIDAAALRLQQTAQTEGGALIRKGIELFQPKRGPMIRTPIGNFPAQSFPINNIERFDVAYQQLNDLIDQAYKSGNGYAGRVLTQFKNDLLNEVHAFDAAGNPTRNAVYAQARNAYRLSSDEIEAIDLGRKALREDSEVSVETWRALDPAHRRLFRIGLEEAVRSAGGRLTRNQDATRLFQTRRVQELFREVIPRSGSGGEFVDRPERFGFYIERQGRQARVRQEVMGGSQTAERLQEDSKFAADAVTRFVQGARGFGNMGLELLANAAQKAFGMRADVAVQLARMLTETDPVRRSAVMWQIAQQYGQPATRAFATQVSNYGLLLTPAAPAESAEERRRGG